MASIISGEEIQRTIYVGNIDETIDADALKSIFITFGEIKNIDIPFDYQTNKPKGYAFIEFEEEEDSEHAIDNYDDAEVYGRIIRVKRAKPQRLKQGSSKPIWETENWHKVNVQTYEGNAEGDKKENQAS